MIFSNIVKKDKMREVQSETLAVLKEALLNSFGPMGSNTVITKKDMLTKYSKDGHTILSEIKFVAPIEESVRQDLEDITRHIVKNIGDGTTSAVILSSIIFEKLKELEGEYTPYELIRDFRSAVELIKKEIKSSAREFNPDRAYDISLISTNGNTLIAENMKSIYEKYGSDVFIDVSISNTTESLIKEYDGMTLSTGYSDSAYINNKKKGVCSLRNPRIYMFDDPVDTPEMMTLLVTIIENNIMNAYRQPDSEKSPIPTVIMAPMISKDMGSYITQLVEYMFQFDGDNKPPFLMVTDMHQMEQLSDIARMCGCKPISKYINPDQQKKDIEAGRAPSLENVTEFYGQADIVEADALKTKFVNPLLMHDEEGNLSETFNTLLKFLEVELEKAIEANQDNNVTGTLKRRINSLKANMVEFLVGGVSMSDRDAVRDLVEDSVLNCRAAAREGVGYGANFEGLLAADRLSRMEENRDNIVLATIYEAYRSLVQELYSTRYSKEIAVNKFRESIKKEMPINLKTDEFDGRVLCSITSDIVVLDAISKIVTLMFTSNQFLCPTAQQNKYLID